MLENRKSYNYNSQGNTARNVGPTRGCTCLEVFWIEVTYCEALGEGQRRTVKRWELLLWNWTG